MKQAQHRKKHLSTIGVFDSGLGGFFLLKALRRRFKDKSFIYLADRAGFPYGEKPPDLIRSLVRKNITFLADQGAEHIITACNTACSVLEDPANYPVPVKEIVSASLKQARGRSLNNTVGLLATEAAVRSRIFLKKAEELNMNLQIYPKACPLLAPFVEQGGWKVKPGDFERSDSLGHPPFAGRDKERKTAPPRPEAQKETEKRNQKLFSLLEEYLKPLLDKGVDTLILGCTHYLYLKAAVERYMGEGKKAVGPVECLIQDLQEEWAGRRPLGAEGLSSKIRVFISGPIHQEFEKKCLEIGSEAKYITGIKYK